MFEHKCVLGFHPMHLSRERILLLGQWALVLLVALVFTITVAKPIILSASDLGRHLMNGKLFLDVGQIATTNLYSYTHPDFPFLNHHWGSGVFFELARRAGGFVGVSLFGLTVIFATVIVYLRIAWRFGGFWLSMCAAALALPVFAGRAEIRPELFSYLLSGVFLWILLHVRAGGSKKFLIALPLLLLAWVNLHIYFFLGIGWMGAFFLDALVRSWLITERRQEHLSLALWLGVVLAVACVLTPLNPNGWQGAVYPLFIFTNYAYSVAENQSISVVLAKGPYAPALYARALIAILGLSWAWRLYRDKREGNVPDVALLILSIFASFIAWGAIRNLTILSYVSLAALPIAWNDESWTRHLHKRTVIRACAPFLVFLLVFLYEPRFWKSAYRITGVGVTQGTMDSIAFFKTNGLRGPIFNNYDIGGMLTYGLFPTEKVFVDNRPEAYPGEFFTETLLPMQRDENVWETVHERYGFNAIFFYRHDATSWGQGFMIRRILDPAWAPVFVDDFTIILLRRTPENAAVIEKFEIPQSKFSIKPR